RLLRAVQVVGPRDARVAVRRLARPVRIGGEEGEVEDGAEEGEHDQISFCAGAGVLRRTASARASARRSCSDCCWPVCRSRTIHVRSRGGGGLTEPRLSQGSTK